MKARLAAAVAALLVAASIVAPIGAASAGVDTRTDGTLTAGVEADLSPWTGAYKGGDDVVRYGVDAHPGWVVFYEEGHGADLASWANSSSERVIQADNPDSRYMIISAPPDHIGLSTLSWLSPKATLLDLAYIEAVDVNRRVSVDPITRTEHKRASEWDRPAGGWMATYGGLKGSFEADGAAWGDEVNTSSLQEARQAIDDTAAADGTGVRVAIIDTGLDYSRDLYGSRVVAGKNTITNETLNISDPSTATASDYAAVADGSDSNHGSWIATAIAGNGTGANATGVAPNATLVPIKALADDGSGTTADIAEGLEYACGPGNADIVSMSLGSALPSAQLQAEIAECLESGEVSAVVVAAGNSRLTYRYVASPADEEGVITVAATDAKAPADSESAYFSNVGPDPETGKGISVGAPGMKITAETADGNVTLSGTSMATPLVSGSLAVAIDAHPELRGDPAAVRTRLDAHAEPIPAAGTTEVGAGRINTGWLVDGTTANETQSDARTADAEGRDTANTALAGSWFRSTADAADSWIPLSAVPSGVWV